ncbi:hypothetical protein [Bradyrhizobium elkanii]
MTDEAVTDEKRLEFATQARQLLALFNEPFWGATRGQTDEMHLADYCETLAKGRTDLGLAEETTMHAVMGPGDIVYAFTGNTPNAGDRAKALVGFINTMPFLLDALEELIDLRRTHSARVTELITHNSEQLMENRSQRDTIRQLKATVAFLMQQIPGVQAA